METEMTSSSMTLDDETPPRPRRRVWLVALLLVAAIGGLALWRARARTAAGTADSRSTGGGAGRAGADSRPVPVVTATVARRDVPVFLEGLGTVAAFKTVTVRSRVDGQLQSVAFKEGQAVKRGTLLAEIDPRPFLIQLHQAEAALARDQAQLRGSRLNLERYVAVRKDKLIAQQQVDDQQASVEQLEATVKADQAQIENARLLIDYARITSPIDGVTGLRLVDPGNMVHANDANGLVIVAQLDPIAMLFTLPQDHLPAVAAEMAKGPLTVYALSRDGRKDIGKGQLELIDNQINPTTSTMRLKAVFPNPEHALWPNQFAKARLLLTTRRGALVVPAVAIQRGPRGTFVYVVTGADKARKAQQADVRAVEIDGQQEDLVLVARGLQEGEQVVVDGQSQLRPGAPVQARATPDGRGRGGGGAGGPGLQEARPEGRQESRPQGQRESGRIGQ
jgi:multidrug efflux system membrane fusion protein